MRLELEAFRCHCSRIYEVTNCKTWSHGQLRIRHTENRCKYAFVLVAISSVKVETLTMPPHAPGGMLARKMQAFVCAWAVGVHTHMNGYPSHRREMHMDTTVKLLPGTQRFREEKNPSR